MIKSLLSVVISVERLPCCRGPTASQDSDVGPAEGGVAEGVQDRVDGGVDVAKVVRELPQDLRDVDVGQLLAKDPVENH